MKSTHVLINSGHHAGPLAPRWRRPSCMSAPFSSSWSRAPGHGHGSLCPPGSPSPVPLCLPREPVPRCFLTSSLRQPALGPRRPLGPSLLPRPSRSPSTELLLPGPSPAPGRGLLPVCFLPSAPKHSPGTVLGRGGSGPTHYKAPVLPLLPPDTAPQVPEETHPPVSGGFPSSLPVTLFLLRSRTFRDISFYSDFLPLSCWPGPKNNIQTTESNRGAGGDPPSAINANPTTEAPHNTRGEQLRDRAFYRDRPGIIRGCPKVCARRTGLGPVTESPRGYRDQHTRPTNPKQPSGRCPHIRRKTGPLTGDGILFLKRGFYSIDVNNNTRGLFSADAVSSFAL